MDSSPIYRRADSSGPFVAPFCAPGIRPMLVIILFTLVLHVFLSESEIIGQLGPLKVTKRGCSRAA